MADPVVYRSTHPDVLAHWEATAGPEAQQAWRDRVAAALDELGFEGRRFIVSDYIDVSVVTGVEHPSDEPIPEGWRLHPKRDDAIAPRRSTRLGKAADRLLSTLVRPNPRKGMPGGMPHIANAARACAFLSAAAEPIDGALYVRWSQEISERDRDQIDTAVWERVRLSEYYAACEKADAAQVEVRH